MSAVVFQAALPPAQLALPDSRTACFVSFSWIFSAETHKASFFVCFMINTIVFEGQNSVGSVGCGPGV